MAAVSPEEFAQLHDLLDGLTQARRQAVWLSRDHPHEPLFRALAQVIGDCVDLWSDLFRLLALQPDDGDGLGGAGPVGEPEGG